ncbi:unnamed protein product [Notodromas monacha]|uniref:Uncharacterized protein n=1 Tax=Notodromas monacha TaxID=399045 RepID=A0A7R9GDT7_9CRUS|nr:unnamed protein product [Notodromas monacha]CAG0917555.1 unnamed protein product [Notodromas monacha]
MERFKKSWQAASLQHSYGSCTIEFPEIRLHLVDDDDNVESTTIHHPKQELERAKQFEIWQQQQRCQRQQQELFLGRVRSASLSVSRSLISSGSSLSLHDTDADIDITTADEPCQKQQQHDHHHHHHHQEEPLYDGSRRESWSPPGSVPVNNWPRHPSLRHSLLTTAIVGHSSASTEAIHALYRVSTKIAVEEQQEQKKKKQHPVLLAVQHCVSKSQSWTNLHWTGTPNHPNMADATVRGGRIQDQDHKKKGKNKLDPASLSVSAEDDHVIKNHERCKSGSGGNLLTLANSVLKMHHNHQQPSAAVIDVRRSSSTSSSSSEQDQRSPVGVTVHSKRKTLPQQQQQHEQKQSQPKQQQLEVQSTMNMDAFLGEDLNARMDLARRCLPKLVKALEQLSEEETKAIGTSGTAGRIKYKKRTIFKHVFLKAVFPGSTRSVGEKLWNYLMKLQTEANSHSFVENKFNRRIRKTFGMSIKKDNKPEGIKELPEDPNTEKDSAGDGNSSDHHWNCWMSGSYLEGDLASFFQPALDADDLCRFLSLFVSGDQEENEEQENDPARNTISDEEFQELLLCSYACASGVQDTTNNASPRESNGTLDDNGAKNAINEIDACELQKQEEEILLHGVRPILAAAANRLPVLVDHRTNKRGPNDPNKGSSKNKNSSSCSTKIPSTFQDKVGDSDLELSLSRLWLLSSSIPGIYLRPPMSPRHNKSSESCPSVNSHKNHANNDIDDVDEDESRTNNVSKRNRDRRGSNSSMGSSKTGKSASSGSSATALALKSELASVLWNALPGHVVYQQQPVLAHDVLLHQPNVKKLVCSPLQSQASWELVYDSLRDGDDHLTFLEKMTGQKKGLPFAKSTHPGSASAPSLTLVFAESDYTVCVCSDVEWREAGSPWGGPDSAALLLAPDFRLLTVGACRTLSFNATIDGYPKGLTVIEQPLEQLVQQPSAIIVPASKRTGMQIMNAVIHIPGPHFRVLQYRKIPLLIRRVVGIRVMSQQF